MNKVKVGIIGLGQRGVELLSTMLFCEEADIVAVCDVYPDRVQKAIEQVQKERHMTPVGYDDYRKVLADREVQMTVISTSWQTHVRIAVDSMKAGKVTAVEVSGAYDVEDCWQLVRTYEETRTPFVFLENCCFGKFELLSTALYRAGKLGTITYCHGAYSHDLRWEILGGVVNRHYRLENYKRRNCENYPTHEVGPIAKLLDICRGNRFMTISSFASKAVSLHEFAQRDDVPDKNQANTHFAQGDVVVSTLTCANGEIVTLKLNTNMPTYYAREFTVRGTRGFCEQNANIVMIEPDSRMEEYFDTEKFFAKNVNCGDEYADYLPDFWRNITPEIIEKGHGGMDYFQFKTIFDAVLNNKEMPIDVYDAATWMSITCLSEQSIAMGGTPQLVPDFTRGEWVCRKSKDVVDLTN